MNKAVWAFGILTVAGVTLIASFSNQLTQVASYLTFVAVCVMYFFLAGRFQRFVIWTSIFLLVVIPVYWAPPISGLLPLTPSNVLIIPLAIALVFSRPWPKFSQGDAIFFALFTWSAVAICLHWDFAVKGLAVLLAGTLAPYAVGRFVSTNRSRVISVSSAIQISGVLVSLLAIYEHFSGVNLFLEIIQPQYTAEVWAHVYSRNGEIRAAASLAQPLVLSLFLTGCVTLAIVYRSGLVRICLIGIYLAGITASGSRLAYFIVLLALVLKFAHVAVTRTILSLVASGIAILLGSILGFWDSIIQGSDALAANSVNYRGMLFESLLSASDKFFGFEHADKIYYGSFVEGFNGSIDNQYLLWVVQIGSLGVLLVLSILIVAISRLSREKDKDALAWTLMVIGSLVSFFFVASVVQEATIFWITLGIWSGVSFSTKTKAENTFQVANNFVGSSNGIRTLQRFHDDRVRKK